MEQVEWVGVLQFINVLWEATNVRFIDTEVYYRVWLTSCVTSRRFGLAGAVDSI